MVFIDLGGRGALYLLDLNTYFPPQIREVLSYDLFKYAFWPSVPLGTLWNPNST